MKLDLAAAMRRASDFARSSDLLGARHIIGSWLFGPEPESPEAVRKNEPAREPEAGAQSPDTGPSKPSVLPADESDTERAADPQRRSRPLSMTLRLLEQGKAAFTPSALRQPAPTQEIPEGARFEARAFACPEGSRDYKLYVPSRADDGLRGLVVMLHGCTQDADDFAVGTAMNEHAERERLLVAYPCQAKTHNALCCWNWFNPDDQRRDAGEPAIIAGIAQALLAEFSVKGNSAMVAGLSAGGSMAAVLGVTYPDLFSAVGIHSGLPYGIAHDAASAFAAMRGEPGDAPGGAPSCRTIVFHGDADRTVHPYNASRFLSAAGPGDIRQGAGTTPGGRPYRVETLVDAHGRTRLEMWTVEGAGHAWFGGDRAGSYTDPDGPDASAELVRFFLEA